MNLRRRPDASLDEHPRPGESFLQRLHRRKTEARADRPAPPAEPMADGAATTAIDIADDAAAVPTQAAEERPPLTDADMPPIESLTADSDYSGFLSERVSESLRRAALRKLFHGPAFNVTDGLDEYAEDFTTFEALGDILTADMRHQLEVEARKRADAIEEALTEDADDVEEATVADVDDTAAADAGGAPAEAAADPSDRAPGPGTTPKPTDKV